MHRMRSLLGRPSLPILLALVVLVVAKGVAWTIVMPIGQQPDEPSHAVYAEHVQRTWQLNRGPRPSSYAFDQMLAATGYHNIVFRAENIGSMDDRILAQREKTIVDSSKEGRDRDGGYAGTAFGYPPLAYTLDAVGMQLFGGGRIDTAYLVARLVNVLIAALVVVVQFFVLLRMLGALWKAGAAALFLTMMPMYSSIQSSINPDNLMGLWVALQLLLLQRVLDARHGLPIGRWRDHVALAAVLGAALFTKQSGVVLALPYLGVMSHVLWKHRSAWKPLLVRTAVTVGAPFVAFLAWYVGPARPSAPGADGNLLAVLPAAPVNLDTIQAFVQQMAREGMYRFNDLYWGGFGWVDVPVPTLVASLGAVLAAFTVVTIVIRTCDEGLPSPVVLAIGTTTALLALFAFTEFRFVIGSGQGIFQGRYLFPVAVAIVGCQFWAVDSAFSARRRLADGLLIALPIAMAVYQVVALLGLVVPRYYL